jgi:hypothetical protein
MNKKLISLLFPLTLIGCNEENKVYPVIVEHKILDSHNPCYRELFVDHNRDGSFDEYVLVNGEKDCGISTVHYIKPGYEPKVFYPDEIEEKTEILQTPQLKYNLLYGHWK